MSGSLGPIGGVDASIPLQAGKIMQNQPNPLASVGDFARTLGAINQTKLFPGQLAQQTQATLNTQRSGTYGFLAPFLALPPEQWTHQGITDALARAEHAGFVTQPVLADLASAPSGDGASLSAYMRPQIAAGMQTAAESRLAAVTPSTHLLPVGDQTLPLTIAPAGAPVPGVPTQSSPGFGQGYTPGERLGVTTRKATQADVDRDPRLTVGQDIPIPQTEVVKPYSAPVGGARVPIGGLGPGGYTAPQKPLTQLGPAYQPPGAPAAAPSPPVPGARLMKGAGGSFWVPADKVSIFQQNGYR